MKKKFLIPLLSVSLFLLAIWIGYPYFNKFKENDKAAAPAVVEVKSSVLSDGTTPFDATNFTPPSTNSGNDLDANNGVVRVGDSIRYQVDTSLNGASDNNVRFTFVADQYQIIPSLPSQCLIDPSLVSPISSISTDKKTMFCNLGYMEEGTEMLVRFNAIVLGSTPNNTAVKADVSARSDTSTTVTSPQLSTLATAAPKLDLVKTYQGSTPPRQYGSGRILLYGIALVGERGGMSMKTPQTYTIHDTFIGDDGTGANPFDNTWSIRGCGINGDNNQVNGLPYGKLSYGDSKNSVIDSGTVTCTNKTSTGFDITFTGVDGSMTSIPSYTIAGTQLQPGNSYIATAWVEILLPNAIIPSTNVSVKNYVQFTATPKASNNIDNYNNVSPTAEPGGATAPSGTGNNFTSITMANPLGTHCIGITADGELGDPCGAKSNNNTVYPGQVYGDYNTPYSAVRITELSVAPYSPGYNDGNGVTNVTNCVKFDPSTTEFVDFVREGRKTYGVNHDNWSGVDLNGLIGVKPELGWKDPNMPYIAVYTYNSNQTWASGDIYRRNDELFDNGSIAFSKTLTHIVSGAAGSGNGLGISYPTFEYSTSQNDGQSASMSAPGTIQYYTDYYNEQCGNSDGPWTTLDPSNMPSAGTLASITKIRLKYNIYKDSVNTDMVNHLSAYFKVKIKPTVAVGSQVPFAQSYGRNFKGAPNCTIAPVGATGATPVTVTCVSMTVGSMVEITGATCPNTPAVSTTVVCTGTGASVGTVADATIWNPINVPPVLDPANKALFFADQSRAARVTVIGAVASVTKGIILNNTRVQGDHDILAGETRRFYIQPALTGDPSAGTSSIKLSDVLPNGFQYVGNVTTSGLGTGQTITNPSVQYNTPSAGQTTVEWIVSGITPGQSLPEIQYDAKLASDARSGTYTNTVTISTLSGAMDTYTPTCPIAPATSCTASESLIESKSLTGFQRNHSSGITMHYDSKSAFHIEKNVNSPLIDVNENMEYDLIYANYSGNRLNSCQPGTDGTLETTNTSTTCAATDLPNADPLKLIDIFPHNGDTLVPPTTIGTNSQLLFGKINQSATGLESFYFTNKTPSTINQDPANAFNSTAGVINSTNWCGPYTGSTITLAQVQAGACGAGFMPTAVMIESPNQMPVGSAPRHVTLTLSTSNNTSLDTYTNEFSGRVDEIALHVISNDVNVKVFETSQSGTVWNDKDSDGIIDNTEPLIADALVCIDGKTATAGAYGVNVTNTKLDAGVDHIFGTADDKRLCTKTDNAGKYQFNHLHKGNYYIEVDPTAALGTNGTPILFTKRTYDGDGTGTQDNSTHATADNASTGTYTIQVQDAANPTGYYLDQTNNLPGTTQVLGVQDFGYAGYKVSGSIWADVSEDNLHGVLASCGNTSPLTVDCGLGAVNVTLYDSNGNVVATTTSNTLGYYEFTNVAGGTYSVKAGVAQGLSDVSGQNPKAVTVVNADVANIDIPKNTGSICGNVYLDTNNNGTKETGETTGIVTTITLAGTDVNGNAVNVTATSTAGAYCFKGLIASQGSYTVTETQPTTYADGKEELGNVGGTVGADKFDVQLNAGSDGINYNFGEINPGAVSGYVKVDNDGNETPDANLTGITLTLTCGAVTQTTTTDSTGLYKFTNVAAGTCSVTETQPSGYNSAPTINVTDNKAATLISGIVVTTTEVTGNNFLEQPIVNGSIRGIVFNDTDKDSVLDGGELGIQNVIVKVYANATCTAPSLTTVNTLSDGSYLFSNLSAGTYCIEEVQPTGYGNSLNPTNKIQSIVVNGTLIDNNNFGDTLGSICGKVYLDVAKDSTFNGVDTGISLVKMELLDSNNNVVKTAYTNASGDYCFKELRADNYTVLENQPSGYTNTETPTNMKAITLTAAQDSTGNNFGEGQVSLSGRVYQDDNNNGIYDTGEAGIITTLTLNTGATVNSAADGTYSFTGLSAGTYSVTETQPSGFNDGSETIGNFGGSKVVNDVISGIIIGATDATGYNFGEIPVGDITGTIWFDVNYDGSKDATETTYLSGIIITLQDCTGNDIKSDTTDTNGYYEFLDISIGCYKVVQKVQPTGYGSSTPDSVDITLTTAGETVDFGESKTGSISGKVFADKAKNSVLDSVDLGIEGVIITLKGTDGLGNTVNKTATTDSSGNYSFAIVNGGTYDVEETQPTNYSDEVSLVGSKGGTAGTNKITGITIVALETGINYNFGEVGGSIKGTIFKDTDKDGVKDTGEEVFPSVEVKAKSCTGTKEYTVLSDANGSYSLEGLAIDCYVITETIPSGYSLTTTNGVQKTLTSTNPDVLGVEFGNNLASTVVVLVYSDLKCDKAMNNTDTGLKDYSIRILDKDGKEVAKGTTDTNGKVTFTSVYYGDYTIELTKKDDSLTVNSSAKVLGTTSQTVTVSSTGGSSVDFGICPKLSTTGVDVWWMKLLY